MNCTIIRRLPWIVFLLLTSSLLLAQPENAPNIAMVVTSADVEEPLTNADLNLCLRETARVMKVEGTERPQMVVIQLSSSVAKQLGLRQTFLMVNSLGKPKNMYEVWLVGREPLFDLARAVAMVYEFHYGMNYDPMTRGSIVAQIASSIGGKTTQEQPRGR